MSDVVLLLVVGVIGLTIPFWLNRERVREKAGGTYTLSLEDETIGQLTLGLIAFVALGTAMIAIILAVRRHYRCPKCNEVPMGSWTTSGPGSIGFDEGVAFNPSVCPNCGAQGHIDFRGGIDRRRSLSFSAGTFEPWFSFPGRWNREMRGLE